MNWVNPLIKNEKINRWHKLFWFYEIEKLKYASPYVRYEMKSKNEIAHQDIGKFTLHDKHHLENHLKNRRSEIRIHSLTVPYIFYKYLYPNQNLRSVD